jgi:hypothetical protein
MGRVLRVVAGEFVVIVALSAAKGNEISCRGPAFLAPARPPGRKNLQGAESVMRSESLPPAELEREAARLLEVCVERGLEAVLPEVADRPALRRALADACFRRGLTEEGQYLTYLDSPFD